MKINYITCNAYSNLYDHIYLFGTCNYRYLPQTTQTPALPLAHCSDMICTIFIIHFPLKKTLKYRRNVETIKNINILQLNIFLHNFQNLYYICLYLLHIS